MTEPTDKQENTVTWLINPYVTISADDPGVFNVKIEKEENNGGMFLPETFRITSVCGKPGKVIYAGIVKKLHHVSKWVERDDTEEVQID